ncbi:hypothetical protein SDC9_210044 [bioreactor metagenome]|uniref:Uncharacterized protein n=1 Tax=bioreactor metagenome TaxID=1076179 RepID=A0A645JG06_9ZZZZ
MIRSTAKLRITPKLRLDSCNQFQWIERLRHIIIRTYVKAKDLICVFGFYRENNDWHIVGFPDLKGGSDPVQFWHHDVDYQKVYLLLAQYLQCFFPIICL